MPEPMKKPYKPPTMQQRIDTMQAEVMRALEKETAAMKAKERAERNLALMMQERDAAIAHNQTTVDAAMKLSTYHSGQFEKLLRLLRHRTYQLFLSWAMLIFTAAYIVYSK